MIPASFDGLMPVVIFMGLAVLLFFGGHFLSVALAPKKPSHLKSTPYECGELPVGSAWSMFNVRFYVVGLIFIIFDVESALLFPIAAIFKELNDMGQGAYALIDLVGFVSVLVVGIAYCWNKGDLDWVKSFQHSNNKEPKTK